MRAAHRRFGRIARAPPPQIAAGERVGVKMLGEKMLSVLAKSLSDSTSGPGRHAVAATAGALQRRPVRAHAQRRRLRTTRAAARASEERENEERHAV